MHYDNINGRGKEYSKFIEELFYWCYFSKLYAD